MESHDLWEKPGSRFLRWGKGIGWRLTHNNDISVTFYRDFFFVVLLYFISSFDPPNNLCGWKRYNVKNFFNDLFHICPSEYTYYMPLSSIKCCMYVHSEFSYSLRDKWYHPFYRWGKWGSVDRANVLGSGEFEPRVGWSDCAPQVPFILSIPKLYVLCALWWEGRGQA